ncbi:hypothetical protein BGZ83_002274 [Gryganskiella cystojenkinii]|nr:hypothetical protein BGZ83_002274 [Gryganskiella cystojenkinii]
MKLSLSLSVLVSTLAFTAPTVAAASQHPSTVYFFSNGRSSANTLVDPQDIRNVPELSLKETRATLSHLLNLGESVSHDRLGHKQDDEVFLAPQGPVQQVFAKPGVGRKNLFENLGGNLMMVIEGVQNVNDIMPTFEPVFSVDATSEDVQGLVTDLATSVPAEDRYLFDTHRSSKSGDALVNEHLVADHHANVDVTVFDLSKKADALFLEESVSLGNYMDSYVKKHSKHGEETDFIRITLKGLAALATEHGADSIQYKTAAQIVREFLQLTFIPEFEQIHKAYTATIVLIEPNTHQGSELFSTANDKDSNKAQSRARNWKRALPPSASTTCFDTEVDCQTSTNGCTQRGHCILSVAANCYHCQCSKINNTQYGGKTCEKIDVSIQFHLFFWLILGLVLAVVLAVGLIIQMGNQSQGGVPVGPTRAQLKRD